jgi:hypothetical protein
VVSYSVVSPFRVSSGGGDDAFIASSKDFLVMTTFQSVGLVDGERVPLVRTLVNSSFTTVRMGGYLFNGMVFLQYFFEFLSSFFFSSSLFFIVQSVSIVDINLCIVESCHRH